MAKAVDLGATMTERDVCDAVWKWAMLMKKQNFMKEIPFFLISRRFGRLLRRFSQVASDTLERDPRFSMIIDGKGKTLVAVSDKSYDEALAFKRHIHEVLNDDSEITPEERARYDELRRQHIERKRAEALASSPESSDAE